MKILLVNPPRFKGISVIREERCEITEKYSVLPPYSLLQVASLLRANSHEVQLIDANGWNLSLDEVSKRISDENYELLLFRFAPTTFDWDNQVASISKRIHPKALTVGVCWTLHTVPRQVLAGSPSLDVYVRHEYESVVPSLITAITQGIDLANVRGIAYRIGKNVKVTSDAEALSDWDTLPLPAYDLLPSLKCYFINTPHGSPFTIMYTSKGCPYSCVFCTVRNTQVKMRSANSILSELRYLKSNYNIKLVSFFDETFTFDRARVIAICEALKNEDLKISWYCNTRVGLVDSALLKKMYSAGCRGLSYGVESGSQLILNNAKKGSTVAQAENAIKWAKDAQLKVLCSFIFGLPGENWGTVQETIKFVKSTLPTGAQFNLAVPYPGSELNQLAVEKGWIKLGVDWRNMYQHDAVMRTDELSFEDLVKARQMAYRALYSDPKWWLQNVQHAIRHLDDFSLATRYALKVINNYNFNKMVHVH